MSPFIYFVVEPHILEQNGHLAAMFAPSDALLDYPIFTVRVEPIATGANFILVDSADVDRCLQVLMLGRQITIRMISETEQLASFPLENDICFAEAFFKLKRQLLGP